MISEFRCYCFETGVSQGLGKVNLGVGYVLKEGEGFGNQTCFGLGLGRDKI